MGAQLNIKIAFVVITLFIVDLLFQKYLWYAITVAVIYGIICIIMMTFVIYHICGSLHQSDPTHSGPISVDILEIGESATVLIGSLIAMILYAASKVEYGKIKVEYGAAFIELMAWTAFFICQYIFICYIQFNIDRIKYGPQFLILSGAVSAVTTMYLFVFEYYHLISLLTEYKDFTTDVKVAYALFWCPIEYLVWSFVTANHMLHHLSGHGAGHHDVHLDAVHTDSDGDGHGRRHPVADVLSRSKKTIEPIWRQQSTMLFVQPKSQMHLNKMVFDKLRGNESDSDVEVGYKEKQYLSPDMHDMHDL